MSVRLTWLAAMSAIPELTNIPSVHSIAQLTYVNLLLLLFAIALSSYHNVAGLTDCS